MITIPSLGNLALSGSSPHGSDMLTKSGNRNGSVLEMFLGSRDHSNRGSREGSMGPPSRQSSNASVSSITSSQDAGSTGSQFFEVLYLGKIKSVSHRKAPPTFIDDVLEKFRAHNQLEEQRVRQTSLPVHTAISSFLQTARFPRPTSMNDICGDTREVYEGRHIFTRKLVDTQEEEETSEAQSTATADTLSILKQTEEVLKTLSDRIEPLQKNVLVNQNEVEAHHQDLSASFRVRTASGGISSLPPRKDPSLEPLSRGRANSTGSASALRPKRVNSTTLLEVPRTPPVATNENNRTMLLQISRCDVKLISPDRKSVMLSKPFCDISHCSQGIKNPENFGFICRDTVSDNNVCYVFKCQSNSVADEIMTVLKLASHSASESQKRVNNNLCEHCPSVWLQRLMTDVEGLPDQKAHTLLLRRIGTLPEADQEQLVAKYKGADLIKTSEQNDLLLLLLKAHCEARQMTHVHDTAENRHEFLSQYFDGSSGTIFKKAKRSLSNSFDQLLKRKTKEEMELASAQSTFHQTSLPNRIEQIENEKTPSKQSFRFDMADGLSQSPLTNGSDPRLDASRPRSSTLCSSHGATIKKELKEMQNKRRDSREQKEIKIEKLSSPTTKSPIMEIFFKVGSPSPAHIAHPPTDTPSPRRPSSAASWRQAIFQQVMSPNQNNPNEFCVGVESRKYGAGDQGRIRRTRENYRMLWQKAIKQQIILIRMEKENKRLKAHQEEMAIKRMKLNYDEIVPCLRPASQLWEKLLGPSSGVAPDFPTLARAVEKGVPKHRRGEAWQALVNTRNAMETQQPSWCRHAAHDDYSLSSHSLDYENFPLFEEPYEDLLGQLTSHQHAIIIDLGRTFPTQKYFQASLGPGQLSLYNLLKAYSLLDNEVGYCQGLSFIAGVLLMHLEEKEAYYMLRYLMLELGLRRQYLPNMAALQVQLYQMARLLRDSHRDLYEHLEENEISPTLYAAPWFLTLFASQFPLGFVVRVFDLVFMNGMSMVFRVALSLIADHKDMLLQCRNFEQLMDYFKTTLPSMGASQLERVIREALGLDISRQLAAYEVEYHVLQEEIVAGIASPVSPQQHDVEDWKEKARHLEESNMALQKQVRELQAQLQSAKVTTRILENNLSASQSKYARLEREVSDYESDRHSLIHLIADLMKRLPAGQEIVIPPDIARCLEDFRPVHEGGIAIMITPSSVGSSASAIVS